MTDIELWNDYKKANNIPDTVGFIESFHFEMTEYWANELLKLVLDGVKKATSSALPMYEKSGSKIPEVGDYNIITDWYGNARCVIKTTRVRIIPFKDITYDICKLEGEDDTLESWRGGHIEFFRADGEETGYEFTEEMPVVFEEFEVMFSR